MSLVNQPFVWPVNQKPVVEAVVEESSDEEDEVEVEEAQFDPDEVYVSENEDELPVSKHYLASAPVEEQEDDTHLFFN